MIKIQEVPIEEVIKINALIPEFNEEETYIDNCVGYST